MIIERGYLYKAFFILLIGTILGIFIILKIGDLTLLLYLHPYFQIYSLMYFVLGIALYMLPRFKSSISNLSMITLAILLLLNASFIIFLIAYFNTFLIEIASFILLISSFLVVYYFAKFAMIKANFPEADGFFLLSSISYSLFVLAFLIHRAFDIKAMFFFFLGFLGSLIYAVEVRMVAIRQTINYRSLTIISFILQLFSLLLLFFSFIYYQLFYFSVISFLITFIIMSFSLRIFETSRPLTIHKLSSKEKRLIYYNQSGMIISYLWLFLTLLLYIWKFINFDMLLHGISLGFVGNTIFSYAPIFVSYLFTKKNPIKSMSFENLFLFNLGVFLRIIGSYYGFPIWSSISGLLIIVSMAILVFKILK